MRPSGVLDALHLICSMNLLTRPLTTSELMVEPQLIETRIKAALGEDTHVEVIDLTGTRDHYKVVVVSASFQGKLPIKQHRMIYSALEEEMKGPIHALTIESYTPTQWASRG